MSEATTIMPRLPSIHNHYDNDPESDNDKDTDQQPSIHNRHEKAAESDNDEDTRNRYEKSAEPDNDEDTDDSDYDSDSDLSDAIATANNQIKEMCKMSCLSASSSPRKIKPAKEEEKRTKNWDVLDWDNLDPIPD